MYTYTTNIHSLDTSIMFALPTHNTTTPCSDTPDARSRVVIPTLSYKIDNTGNSFYNKSRIAGDR
jgi:hypothetical protein